MADVELSVQVVSFVKQGASQEFLTGFLKGFSVNILRAHGDSIRAAYVFAEVWNAQASFTLRVFAFGLDDLRVDQDKLGLGIFLEGDVDDGDALADPNLRRSQADSMRGVHRFKHVLDELPQFFIEDGDRFGGLLENGISVLDYGIDHQ